MPPVGMGAVSSTAAWVPNSSPSSSLRSGPGRRRRRGFGLGSRKPGTRSSASAAGEGSVTPSSRTAQRRGRRLRLLREIEAELFELGLDRGMAGVAGMTRAGLLRVVDEAERNALLHSSSTFCRSAGTAGAAGAVGRRKTAQAPARGSAFMRSGGGGAEAAPPLFLELELIDPESNDISSAPGARWSALPRPARPAGRRPPPRRSDRALLVAPTSTLRSRLGPGKPCSSTSSEISSSSLAAPANAPRTPAPAPPSTALGGRGAAAGRSLAGAGAASRQPQALGSWLSAAATCQERKISTGAIDCKRGGETLLLDVQRLLARVRCRSGRSRPRTGQRLVDEAVLRKTRPRRVPR